jgi:hypothetical protein
MLYIKNKTKKKGELRKSINSVKDLKNVLWD